METIIYQGQPIEATLVNYISGRVTTSTVDCEGDEELFRDEEGCYYLRRKLTELDAEGERRRASRRTLVHCINVNAAILWATTRLNSNTLDLRCDAAALLMEGRGYIDPNPVSLTPTRREMVSDPDRFASRCEPQAGSGRLTVELDDLASAMLRRTCQEGDATHHAGENLHDLVNAAVTFYLSDDRNDPGGEFDFSDGAHALERAKRDRLRLEEAMPPPAISSAGQVRELEVVETPPGVHRFTFDYPATERRCGMQRTVELCDEQMERAHELATIFGLDVPAFLRGLVDHNDLPGQPRRANTLKGLLQAEHLGFVCTDATLAKRIERAAQACGQSVDEFVAYSLGGDVDMWEESMLLHPTTGDLLDTDYEDLYDTIKEEMIVPPVGREDEAQFKMSMGKERVNFGVYLRPEQMERLEYPHFVTDCATGVDHAFALIPLDPEGSPYLSVGKRQLKPGESLPHIEALPSPQPRGEQKGAA